MTAVCSLAAAVLLGCCSPGPLLLGGQPAPGNSLQQRTWVPLLTITQWVIGVSLRTALNPEVRLLTRVLLRQTCGLPEPGPLGPHGESGLAVLCSQG